jgi:TRAP-type C4-dicarboxylate transport system permease small subunit
MFSAVILVYGGIKITSLAMGQLTSSLGVPIGVFYIVLPLCGVLNMIYSFLNVIDIFSGGEV